MSHSAPRRFKNYNMTSYKHAADVRAKAVYRDARNKTFVKLQ